MASSRVTCPECGTVFRPDLEPVSYPGGSVTGNPDHTLVTRDERITCPRCGEQLEVQVKRFIETGLVCWLDGSARVAHHEAWAGRMALFSPGGQRLAVALQREVRVFERDGAGWRPLFSSRQPWCRLTGWDGERWLASVDAVWDLDEQRVVWERPRVGQSAVEVVYDHQRQLLARGGALDDHRGAAEVLEIHDLASGALFRAETGRVSDKQAHVVRWELGRDLAFCARAVINTRAFPPNSYENDHSLLALWRYNAPARRLEQVAEGRLPRGLVQEAWWEPDGTIVVASWYRWIDVPPRSSLHAYGLARLDGTTLELLHEQRWSGPPPELHGPSLWFHQAAPLGSGEIFWHTSRVSLLDRATWAVRETLPYVPLAPERVAFAPDGATYALGRPNDVLIVDRATEHAWSLRRGREVSLRPPTPPT